MTYAIHSNAAETFAKHQDNLMASLAHRLEVARANNNLQLVELLEQEKQQIAATIDRSANSAQPRTQTNLVAALSNGLKRLQEAFAAMMGNSELQVSEFMNGSDRWWYAYNPQTGAWVYADSEVELRLWIKQNYQGK
jgi:hypothetical protein